MLISTPYDSQWYCMVLSLPDQNSNYGFLESDLNLSDTE